MLKEEEEDLLFADLGEAEAKHGEVLPVRPGVRGDRSFPLPQGMLRPGGGVFAPLPKKNRRTFRFTTPTMAVAAFFALLLEGTVMEGK